MRLINPQPPHPFSSTLAIPSLPGISELLSLKGCPLPESRGEDTDPGVHNRLDEQEGSLFFSVWRSQEKEKIQRLGGPSTHKLRTLFPHSITPKISPNPEQSALAQEGTTINRSRIPNSPTSEQVPSPKLVGGDSALSQGGKKDSPRMVGRELRGLRGASLCSSQQVC